MRHLLLIALATTTLAAPDATGTWTGTLSLGDGQSQPAHLVLKQDGDKLTGTAGADPSDQRAIQDGKVDNGTLTFVLSNGMKFVLKQDGEEITGEVTRERNGQTQTAKLAVKRVP